MKGLAFEDLKIVLQIEQPIGKEGQGNPQDLLGPLQRGQEHPEKGHEHQEGPEDDQRRQGP